MKDIKYEELFDIYGALLTENQKTIFEAYYSFDLSLSEIAEEKGVTRQSVADSLKKTRKELDDLEKKLGFSFKTAKIKEFAQALDGAQKEALLNILEK